MHQINMDFDGSAYRELTCWCIAEIGSAHKAKILDDDLANQFRSSILELRGQMDALFEFKDQPVVFFYVHFVCLLTALYLPLFAIQTALDAGTGNEAYWVNDVVSGLVVILQGIFVIGLRILADKMSEPYDSDLEDLSVMHYVEFTWRMSRRMMESKYPEYPVDDELEEQLCCEQQSIGEAWSESSETAPVSMEGEVGEGEREEEKSLLNES